MSGRVQVRSHRDDWDLRRCSLPARLAWTASQALWSAKEAARDVREGGSGAMKKLTDRSDSDEQVGRACVLRTRFLQPPRCMSNCAWAVHVTVGGPTGTMRTVTVAQLFSKGTCSVNCQSERYLHTDTPRLCCSGASWWTPWTRPGSCSRTTTRTRCDTRLPLLV